jgi:hypothetical protein
MMVNYSHNLNQNEVFYLPVIVGEKCQRTNIAS